MNGFPSTFARDDIPGIERYPGGQTASTPKSIDFRPGELLGSVSGELGLRKFLESQRYTFVVTSDKDRPKSMFEKELTDADIVISQPFWPAYLTAERIGKAPRLRLAVTAGIGSDHVDLQAAMDRGITVAEVTYCNSIRVSEHVVMILLALVRNYLLSHQWVVDGGWNVADCVARLPDAVEKELALTFHPNAESLVKVCDVVTINAPLHPETEGLLNDALIAKMKRGAYIVNTARGKICDRDAVIGALKSGQLAGYASDVWFPQPAPRDHRTPPVPRGPRGPRRHDTRQACAKSSNAGLRVGRSAMNISSRTPGSSLEPAQIHTAPAMLRGVPRRRRDSRQRQAGVTLRVSRPSIKSLLGRRPDQCWHR